MLSKDYIFPQDTGKTHLRILKKYFLKQLECVG